MCAPRHPAAGAQDPNYAPQTSDPYVTWRNPFVYFSSLTIGTDCAQNDVDLSHLRTDLKKVSTTANFSYIAPDLCDDGSDQPCTPGAPAGLARGNAFLKTVEEPPEHVKFVFIRDLVGEVRRKPRKDRIPIP